MRPFTSSMRYEHGIIGRAIDELGRLSGAAAFDPAAFLRKTDRLLGVIDAHFEKEEEVFEKELALETAHPHP